MIRIAIVTIGLVLLFGTTAVAQEVVAKKQKRFVRQYELIRKEKWLSTEDGISLLYVAYGDLPVSIVLYQHREVVEIKESLPSGNGYYSINFKCASGGTFTCALVVGGRIIDKMKLRVYE